MSLLDDIMKVLDRWDVWQNWTLQKNITSTSNGTVEVEEVLTPPNYWDIKATTPTINAEQLNDFNRKCDFLARSITSFQMLVVNKRDDPLKQAWLEIFQREAVYPPPDTHPLSQIWKAR